MYLLNNSQLFNIYCKKVVLRQECIVSKNAFSSYLWEETRIWEVLKARITNNGLIAESFKNTRKDMDVTFFIVLLN